MLRLESFLVIVDIPIGSAKKYATTVYDLKFNLLYRSQEKFVRSIILRFYNMLGNLWQLKLLGKTIKKIL